MAEKVDWAKWWNELPSQFRSDGTRYQHRIDYFNIPIPDDALYDPALQALYLSGHATRLICRKKLWRRIRDGYYHPDRPEHEPKAWDDYGQKKEVPKCGAKTRKGHACRNKAAINPHTGKQGSKCKFHGGHSTGPRTEQGKQKSVANLTKAHQNRAKTNKEAA